MFLLTGSTGQLGSRVLQEFIARSPGPFRVMVRTETGLPELPRGSGIVKADLADPISLKTALKGVEAAFLVCGPVPELVRLETNFLLASKEAGINHLVLASALGAGDFTKSFPSWHRQVEETARQLQLPVTIVRPNGFMQNIAAYFAPTIKAQDAFYGTIGDARMNLIDIRDVGSAIAEALIDPSTMGKVYEISGPQAFNYTEVAGLISRVAGRIINYVNLTPQQMKAAMMAAGMPEGQADAILELDEYYAAGKGNASDSALRTLLKGRHPRTLESYLSENSGLFSS